MSSRRRKPFFEHSDRVTAKGKIKITKEEAEAIVQVEAGADVYDYGLAKTLRGLERRGVRGLVDLGQPRMYSGNGADRMPYFGAIATAKGLELALETLKTKQAVHA